MERWRQLKVRLLEAETPDFVKYILVFAAVVFLVGAAALDLFLLFQFSSRDSKVDFPGLDDLKKRNLTLPVVFLTLFTALIFTVPGQVGRSVSAGRVPELSGVIVGSLVYAMSAVLLVAYAVFHGRTSVRYLFHSPKTNLKSAVSKGLLFGVAAIPPTMLITMLTNNLLNRAGFETESQSVIKWLSSPDTSVAARIAIFMSAVIVAPMAEEVIFRGILFPSVYKRKSWFFSSMLISCIFSLIHFHPPSFISIFVLSLFFCAGYSVTGSLVTPIVMHMVFNGSATFFMLI